jgi:hypothetical protein
MTYLAGGVQRQPVYLGKPLSDWLADLDLESSHSQVAAEQAVRSIGTNALPCLLKMLCVRDNVWEQSFLFLNNNQALVRFPVTPASVIRNRALRGYTSLGKAAKGEVPHLIHLLETETSASKRCYFILALGCIGPEAKAAVPALAKAANDPNDDVRKNALWALANIRMWTPDRDL